MPVAKARQTADAAADRSLDSEKRYKMKLIGIGPRALSAAVLTAAVAATAFVPATGTSRSAAYAEPSPAAKADSKPATPAPA